MQDKMNTLGEVLGNGYTLTAFRYKGAWWVCVIEEATSTLVRTIKADNLGTALNDCVESVT